MSDEDMIFVAGHNGMVGSAICRRLVSLGHENILTATRDELDLLNFDRVADFFNRHKITQVYLAAAKVGGIHANNNYPAEFIYENLTLQNNIIHSAHLAGVQKLLFLGSSCIYPKEAPQPMPESALLTGKLEKTNEPYAVAKIAGIKLCESYNRQYGCDYRSVMPTNLYGPGDNFHPENSHVLPALIRRFHEAKVNNAESVTIWGTGTPRREFLHVDDMAEACVYVMGLDKEVCESHTETMQSHINIGCGVDVTIKQLAETIAGVVEFGGEISFDESKPDGTLRKLLDVTVMRDMGWRAAVSLNDGITSTYQWYLNNIDGLRV